MAFDFGPGHTSSHVEVGAWPSIWAPGFEHKMAGLGRARESCFFSGGGRVAGGGTHGKHIDSGLVSASKDFTDSLLACKVEENIALLQCSRSKCVWRVEKFVVVA